MIDNLSNMYSFIYLKEITTDEDEEKTEQAANNQFCMSSGQTIGLGLLVLVLLIVSCAVLIIGIILVRDPNTYMQWKTAFKTCISSIW